jgi:hypothetical protein
MLDFHSYDLPRKYALFSDLAVRIYLRFLRSLLRPFLRVNYSYLWAYLQRLPFILTSYAPLYKGVEIGAR